MKVFLGNDTLRFADHKDLKKLSMHLSTKMQHCFQSECVMRWPLRVAIYSNRFLTDITGVYHTSHFEKTQNSDIVPW